MAFRGERFLLDLDEESGAPEIPTPFSLVGEIQERAPSTAIPPAPRLPTLSASSTGFPAPRQRKPSSFKQRRTNAPTAPAPVPTESTAQDDKKSIDEENRRQLAAMSDAQIQREREELMEQMDPGLLERFLRRANIEEDQKTEFEPPAPAADEKSKPKKSVSFDVPSSAPVLHQPRSLILYPNHQLSRTPVMKISLHPLFLKTSTPPLNGPPSTQLLSKLSTSPSQQRRCQS
jgi:RPAP1-like, N-terminal.